MIDWLSDMSQYLSGVLQAPWFTMGKVNISLGLILGIVLILLVPWYTARAVERAMLSAGRHRRSMRQATVYAFARIARYCILAIGILIGLDWVGIDLSALAIFGGAVGIGIGLGLQTVFNNFVSGIILLVEQTLKTGDFVELESGVRGLVIEIGMRYTLIRTNSAVDIIVPNSEFTDGRVMSWTHGNQFRRLTIPFNVAYGTDKSLVREAGLAAARAVDVTVDDAIRRSDVWFKAFGDSALEFALMVWVGPNAVTRPGSTTSRYLWALDDALREHGIEIPYPHREVHIRSGSLAPIGESPAKQP